MSKDISTEYTRTKNKEEGRRGYRRWKREKITVISPQDYGIFLHKKRRK